MTDDELVALALMQQAAWPAPLPTVDVGEADALLAAAPRGVRSMVTRGLMAGDRGMTPTPTPELLASLEPALAGRLVLSTFIARRDLGFVPEGACTAVYARDDEAALVEAISAGGVHYFSDLPMAEAVSAVGEYIVGVLDEGVSVQVGDHVPVGDALVLCVSAAPASPALLAVAGKGALGLVEVDEDGAVTAVETPDTVGEVLSRILAHASTSQVVS